MMSFVFFLGDFIYIYGMELKINYGTASVNYT